MKDSISLSSSKDSLNKAKAKLTLREKAINKLRKDIEEKQRIIDNLLLVLSSKERYSVSVDSEELPDDIGDIYEYDSPTKDQIDEWKHKYHDLCKNKVRNSLKYYTVPDAMMNADPCLVYLILVSESLKDHTEKQEWFNLYPIMRDDQIYKLYDILYREKRKLIQIEIKYEEKKTELDRKYDDFNHHNYQSASELNQFAYDQAKLNNWGTSFAAIDKAIELNPQEPNYYDSKGELLLMRGRPGDEENAVKMWKKVMELDPHFLSKHKGTTPFYEELKKRGLISK